MLYKDESLVATSFPCFVTPANELLQWNPYSPHPVRPWVIRPSPPSLTSFLLLTQCSLPTQAFLLFLKHTGLIPIPEPLQERFPLPGKPFTQPFFARLDPSTITIGPKVPFLDRSSAASLSTVSQSLVLFFFLSQSKINLFVYLPHMPVPPRLSSPPKKKPFSLLYPSA